MLSTEELNEQKGILYMLLTAILFTSMEPVSKLLSNSGIKSADRRSYGLLGGLFISVCNRTAT